MNDATPADTDQPDPAADVDATVAAEAATDRSPAATTVRRLLKAMLVVALVLVWIRLVLFAWLFPMIERELDSPEIGPGGDPSVEVESRAAFPGTGVFEVAHPQV